MRNSLALGGVITQTTKSSRELNRYSLRDFRLTTSKAPSPLHCTDMAEVLTNILGLYDSIKGVEFQGRYAGERYVDYARGSTTRYLLDVYSDNIRRVMEEIRATDRYDQVWKGIVDTTFWAEKIDGDYSTSITTFKITGVYYHKNLNWMRKEYHAVINVTLVALN